MAKRKGAAHKANQARREAERRERQHAAELRAAAREEARLRREYEKAAKLDEKERQRIYLELRNAEVSEMNARLSERVEQLTSILAATLAVDDYFDLATLKDPVAPPEFDAEGYDEEEEELPPLESVLPKEPGWLGKKLGAMGAWQRRCQVVTEQYQADKVARAEREQKRLKKLRKLEVQHQERIAAYERELGEQHREIDSLISEFSAGEPEAVSTYFSMVLERSSYPDGFPQEFRLAFVPDSKQIVIEYQLPEYSIVPSERSFKYVKASDTIAESARPERERKSIYEQVVAQTALRSVHEIFEADRTGKVDSVVFNGHVHTIDKMTGAEVNPCVITLRTVREAFDSIDLARVDPLLCLKGLSASVSKSPAELTPVRPVLEFNMVDPRYIEEVDVISGLDPRTNLMELSPNEFEGLISNLFAKMGLETRQTQASRDGGVDCVAYDPRPIFGGKVVIQAKRYKNTVGVSAVRDLFGTLQNEGASKGILVTTSGFGNAAFEFAEGKPIELLSGAHLLHLLSEHAGIEAKIVMPEDWRDPVPDS